MMGLGDVKGSIGAVAEMLKEFNKNTLNQTKVLREIMKDVREIKKDIKYLQEKDN